MKGASLQLRMYGDPCLRRIADPVTHVGPAERMLIQAMMQTMYAHKGVGLAAPQVGISQQIFVADTGDRPVVVINPEFLQQSGRSGMEEGCLSIPDVMVNIERPQHIRVRYTAENGESVERSFSHLMARVFQHEYDHLQGTLIVDYATKQETAKISPLLEKLEQQYRSKSHGTSVGRK